MCLFSAASTTNKIPFTSKINHSWGTNLRDRYVEPEADKTPNYLQGMPLAKGENVL